MANKEKALVGVLSHTVNLKGVTGLRQTSCSMTEKQSEYSLRDGERGEAQWVVMRLGLWEAYVTCMWQVDWHGPGSSW